MREKGRSFEELYCASSLLGFWATVNKNHIRDDSYGIKLDFLSSLHFGLSHSVSSELLYLSWFGYSHRLESSCSLNSNFNSCLLEDLLSSFYCCAV